MMSDSLFYIYIKTERIEVKKSAYVTQPGSVLP
jgi:hypothetical protein